MGFIPEVDPEEPVETKPFKFVTGTSAHSPSRETRAISPIPLESIANYVIAGAYTFDFLAM